MYTLTEVKKRSWKDYFGVMDNKDADRIRRFIKLTDRALARGAGC